MGSRVLYRGTNHGHSDFEGAHKGQSRGENRLWVGNPSVMVGQYFWGTSQLHIVMYEFLRAQFRNHPEVDPHTMLYFFEHGEPQVEVSDLKQTVEAQ